MLTVIRTNRPEPSILGTDTFTGGAVWRDALLSDPDSGVTLGQVVFSPGARTHWHTHSGPQWLLITEGTIRVQSWGDPAHDVAAGDAVVFAPGEKHWHGAVAGTRGEHLAVNVNVKTQWLEPVSEEDYASKP